ncbi:MAG: acyl--CoA ligase [Acidimicrobiales bacterium]|nr:acyl--CoA ligase [Acidimicrobiales bacterium]
MPSAQEVEALLTGPGGMFEVVVEDVRSRPTRVYKNRMPSLREVLSLGRARGEETFLVYRDRRVSFGDFGDQADQVARALAGRHGVGPGDRVAVLSANNPEWCVSFWATVSLGAVLVGLNGWWKADEVVYGLVDSGAKVLVADGPRFERLAGRLSECPALEAVYVIDPEAKEEAFSGNVHRFDELLTRSQAEGQVGGDVPDTPGLDPLATPIDEDDPAVILYTSGTTGRAKGAVSTHRSMIANLQNTIYSVMASTMVHEGGGVLPEGGPLVALLTSPLFHVSGCHSVLVVGMAAGSRVVIPAGRFEPVAAMALIEQERVTTWVTVPTMIWRVVEHPERHRFDLSSVVTVAYGGSPAAVELQRRIREAFPNLRSQGNAYGLTETSSAATYNAGAELARRPDSVGRPFPIIELRVVDAELRDVAPGTVGEVLVHGPTLMPGYWNDPSATSEALADGWLRTGDLGYLDDEGYLYITDRAKDVIIRGGENVYCTEIENRLAEHEEVVEAAVIGVPHPTLGEEVKAVVRVEPGSQLSAADVQRFVAATLADFKVPAHVAFTEEPLPRNASGKLLKDILRGRADPDLADSL